MLKCRVIFCFLIAFILPVFFIRSASAQSAPSITSISDNKSQYSGGQIPKYEKYEITFQVQNSVATNMLFPYDANPPSGITPRTGITVYAVFTNPDGSTYNQPAFYYQEFSDQVKLNKEWFYPSGSYFWKVRFSPDKAGNWKYKIVVQDAGGTTQSPETNFSVSDSAAKGFIKVSTRDPRYFEFSDGSFFPALGYNLPEGISDNINPQTGNEVKLRTMSENGMNLSRVWVTMSSIFGESYAPWGTSNKALQTQEPRIGIVNSVNSTLASVFSTYYSGQSPPRLPAGSEYYMWLEFNKTIYPNLAPELSMPRFTPCRYFTNIAVKQNTNYRVRVRYQTVGLEGPLDPAKPYGFAIKRSASELGSAIDACNNPSQTGVTTIAASYNTSQVQNDPSNANWKYLEGTYNTGANDFFGFLYLTFDNLKSVDGDPVAGQAFIDKVWLEEASCSANCLNLVTKPNMDMHTYINQQNAYSFDKFMNLAQQYGVYIKAVMNEKNDRILQTIDYNGQPAANQNVEYFYGNGTTVTKTRWLEQAWWRYIQARWGYSPNIHSWELLNEGGGSSNHYAQADEFGKYMHCRVFGKETVVDPTLGNKCFFNHPNTHLVTTSFFGSVYPWQFWNNGGNAAGYKLYRDIDYADQHYYANVDDTGVLASYYDSALFSYKLSTTNNFSAVTRKPLIRGEIAWGVPASTYFETNAESGEWLHDFIWAGINHGGLMEHFFAGGNLTKQIYNLRANPSFDHRPMFKTFYNFIKDIPLSNGKYQDIAALVSNSNVRAWGQKDLTNARAHLLIANIHHTWYNAMGGYTGGPTPISITPQSGTVTITGFMPNTDLKVQWWDTYQGIPTSAEIKRTDASGNLVLTVSNLTSDLAVKIGEYSAGALSSPIPTPTPTQAPVPGDANGDRLVNETDYQIWFSHYLQTVSGVSNGDFDDNGRVDGLDYAIWLINYNL